MDGSIKEMVRVLKDLNAGGVARRDAAGALGKIVLESVSALSSHVKDKDMDVQVVVEKCMDQLHGLLETCEKNQNNYTLRALVEACEKKGEREVEEYENGYRITASLPNGRSQRLYVMRCKSNSGRDVVRILTMCGKSNKDYEHWALNLNRKLSYATFALQKWNNSEYIALVNNLTQQEATPAKVKRCVKEMAQYGDWIEEKMQGTDEL